MYIAMHSGVVYSRHCDLIDMIDHTLMVKHEVNTLVRRSGYEDRSTRTLRMGRINGATISHVSNIADARVARCGASAFVICGTGGA